MVEGLLYPPQDDPTLPAQGGPDLCEGSRAVCGRHVRNSHLISGGVVCVCVCLGLWRGSADSAVTDAFCLCDHRGEAAGWGADSGVHAY